MPDPATAEMLQLLGLIPGALLGSEPVDDEDDIDLPEFWEFELD